MALLRPEFTAPAQFSASKPCPCLGAADVFETDEACYFKVDIPGLTKSDIKVRVADFNLHVSGERKQEANLAAAHYVTAERQFGTFARSFKLPEGTNISKISASCDHGVLTISVPKIGPKKEGVQIPIASADEEGDGSLNNQFASVPINVFPKPSIGKLVVINSDTPIIDAVKLLAQYRILAAPVRDVTKPDSASWTEKYLGIVDMVSIVFHMLEKLEPLNSLDDFEKEIEKIEEFKKTTVAEAARFARFGAFVPVDLERGNLLDAMLLCGQHAIRRVPVVSTPGGDIVNIITQSALVQTLSSNLERFKTTAACTLASLGMGAPSHVYSVTTEDKLYQAFQLIKQHDVSAVPVIDPVTGAIKGNVSARDVRLIVSSSKVYKLLNMPIRVYLDVVSDGAENSAITCAATDTLEDVIKRMVRSRIHRVYLVDASQRVLRVISLRNILRKFVKEPPGYFGHYFEY